MLKKLRLLLSSARASPIGQEVRHLIGTVTAVDVPSRTIIVKEDSTGVQCSVSLQGTSTLLKVGPGAKSLKEATRVTADQLQVGERVDVRGPMLIAARSVILMAAGFLQVI
ncbi:MAG: hypothetical protein WB992_25150 [Bryobacteraceae bacterium]